MWLSVDVSSFHSGSWCLTAVTWRSLTARITCWPVRTAFSTAWQRTRAWSLTFGAANQSPPWSPQNLHGTPPVDPGQHLARKGYPHPPPLWDPGPSPPLDPRLPLSVEWTVRIHCRAHQAQNLRRMTNRGQQTERKANPRSDDRTTRDNGTDET